MNVDECCWARNKQWGGDGRQVTSYGMDEIWKEKKEENKLYLLKKGMLND